jgi:hypothetical protein
VIILMLFTIGWFHVTASLSVGRFIIGWAAMTVPIGMCVFLVSVTARLVGEAVRLAFPESW